MDFGPERPTRFFANSGAVLRRSAYLQLPGFEPSFFHMYEEPDYALQCVAARIRSIVHTDGHNPPSLVWSGPQ